MPHRCYTVADIPHLEHDMPPSPKRQCNYPGCKVLTATARCPEHTDLNTGKFGDRNRASAKERGYGWEWTKLRLAVLKRDQYQCQVAKREGRLEVADEVDHIINKATWLQRYGTLDGVDDPSNLQAIGKARHDEKSQGEAKGGGK